MNFAEEFWLRLLWLLPLALVLVWGGAYRYRRRLVAFFGEQSRHWIAAKRSVIKSLFVLLALVLIVVGLAGPRFGFEWRDVRQGGVDIMVVFDVSRSMLAEDVSPNRLAFAKREVIDLVNMAKGDRIGLVAFAGSAFVQCPLTADYGALQLFLSQVGTDLIEHQGTDIGFALQVAEEGLKRGGASDSVGQSILLITDGEDLEGEASTAVSALANKGIKVFTMSIGSREGGPIPIAGGGYKKDLNGNLVVTKPDTDGLKALAAKGNGAFATAVPGDKDMMYLYEQGIRASVDAVSTETTRKRYWHEHFPWFLGAAFLFLSLDLLLPDYRKRAVGSGLWFVFLFCAIAPRPALADAAAVRGQELFQQGEYEKAADAFLEAQIDQPQNAQHAYNKGVAAYKAGQYDKAVKAFEESLAYAANPMEKEQALFNLGNAQAKAGHLKEAVEAYDKALAENPESAPAKENRDYVKQLLAQQPPTSQQDSSGQGDESSPSGESEAQEKQETQQAQAKENADDQQQGDEQEASEQQRAQEDGAQDSSEQEASSQQASSQKKDTGEQDGTRKDEKTSPDQQASQDTEEQQEAAASQMGEQENDQNENGSSALAREKEIQDQGEDMEQTREGLTREEAMQVLRRVESYSQRYRYRPGGQPRRSSSTQKDW